MWEEFNAMQTALRNARGRTVGEAMHEAAIISPDTSIMSAANSIVSASSTTSRHPHSTACGQHAASSHSCQSGKLSKCLPAV